MRFDKFLSSIDKGFFDTLHRVWIPEEIYKDLENILRNDITSIRGNEFYHILNVFSKDFESDADLAFQEYLKKKRQKPSQIEKHKKPTNKYQDFIEQFLVLKKDIAAKANIENTRLSKVLNRTVKDFLAYEVYAIAKSQKISVKQAFEQLYK